MSFIDGFIALAATIGTGTCTEVTAPGYNREPISFGTPMDATAFNTTPWSFGALLPGIVAGLAIYDAPTGGNLLLVMPFSARRTYLPGFSPRVGDSGTLRLRFSAMAGFHNGAAYSGTVAAGAVVGAWWDDIELIGDFTVPGTSGEPERQYAQNPLSAGVALSIVRGVLAGATP